MSTNPTISKITIYPVKSLDGMPVQKTTISEGGCLLHDREFAIIDTNDNFIIGKSNPLVHSLRSSVDFENEIISIRQQNETKFKYFHLTKEKKELEKFLSIYFGTPVLLQQNKTGRFLDIPDISGVTILSTASLESISSWYDGMDIDETRKRFRASIEIEGVHAFWEDHLFMMEGKGIEFTAGDITIFGISPRARCVVPTRNSETGEVTPAFPKTFARNRVNSLPDWSKLKEYGHNYHLTVNCYIPSTEVGKTIAVGDEIVIIGENIFY